MKRTVFSNKFKSDSAGRRLQDAIHTLEDDIMEAEKAMLTLDIGGYYAMLSVGEWYDGEANDSPTGLFTNDTPDILAKINMKAVVLEALKLQTLKWKAELLDKYAEYQKFINA